MRGPIEIENIEERRREVGIDDAELREQIRGLAVGDCVLLTLLKPTGVHAEQTLRVRITSIRGSSLRGKVVGNPARAGSPSHPPGTPLAFTTAHIHSIPEPAREALPEGVAGPGRPAPARPCPGQSLNSRRGFSMPPKPTPSRPSAAPLASAPARAAQDPPLTTEERLKRIAALGRRVAEYVEFMGQVGGLNGTSAEAKERAVAAFYERLTVLEGQLARIREELRLG
jgi:hypothetical protein